MDQERIPTAALETNSVDIRCDFSRSIWYWLLSGKEWPILVWQLFRYLCFPCGIVSSPLVFLTLPPTRLSEPLNRKWLIFNYEFKILSHLKHVGYEKGSKRNQRRLRCTNGYVSILPHLREASSYVEYPFIDTLTSIPQTSDSILHFSIGNNTSERCKQ